MREETNVFSDQTQIVTLYRVHPVYIDPLRYGAPDRHAVSSAVLSRSSPRVGRSVGHECEPIMHVGHAVETFDRKH